MHISVRAKIAGLAAGLIAAMAVVAVLGVSSLSKLDHAAEESFATTTQPLARLGTARAKANENRALLNNHILAPTVEDKRKLEAQITANDELIASEIDAVTPTIRTAAGREALDALRSGLAEYGERRHEALAISSSGTDPQTMIRAAELNASRIRPVFD